MKSLFKLVSLLTKKEKQRLIPLTIAVVLMSFLEVVGIGSLGPFMTVVSDPEIIHTQELLSFIYNTGGFTNERVFLIALGSAVFLLLLLSTAFKMVVLYAIYRYAGNRRYTLSHRLFRQYLYQPYSYFLNHNTSELSKNLLAEVDLVVDGVLRPAMDMFARGVLALAIVVFLIILDPLIATTSVIVFALVYGILYGFIRPRLTRHGYTVRDANRIRYKASAEAFGAIKDVKILGKEDTFSQTYASGARRFAVTQAATQILSSLPGQAMHAIAVGFAIALTIIMLGIHGSLEQILPMLTIYAFAVLRMMPNLQHVFQGIAQLRYYSHTVDALHKDMTEMEPPPPVNKSDMAHNPQKLEFNHTLELKNLSFAYPGSPTGVLKGITLQIKKNTTVGFVGTTGCGKTTLVDVIMHLLEPSTGEILVDGKKITEITRWHRNFGYVPQEIYLSDDTVAANIAFGVPKEYRNETAIEQAARVANLHDFVTSELPDGYDTPVGERGIRLSGGQRQRVGIARALYHDPDILVMDEATSALDSVTEDAVMDAIHNLMHTKTIVIIAHRITTVQECDEICLMEHGRIMAQGPYEKLLRENKEFRAMAKVSEYEKRL